MKTCEIGQRVRIVANSRGAYQKKDLIGSIGEIVSRGYDPRYGGSLYYLMIDDELNRYSVSGGFWFPARDLEPVEGTTAHCETNKNSKNEEEKTMLPGYKTASIQFLTGSNKEKTYFYALYDDTIVPNDTVVVSTGHHGLALAHVVFIGGPSSYVSDNREIVCKVDLSAWEYRKEKAEKLQQLKEEMDERVKAYQAVALYELAAEKDPALKAMLDQFKALQEG